MPVRGRFDATGACAEGATGASRGRTTGSRPASFNAQVSHTSASHPSASQPNPTNALQKPPSA